MKVALIIPNSEVQELLGCLNEEFERNIESELEIIEKDFRTVITGDFENEEHVLFLSIGEDFE